MFLISKKVNVFLKEVLIKLTAGDKAQGTGNVSKLTGITVPGFACKRHVFS